MELPNDLKEYRASSGFQLLTEEEAGYVIAVLLVVVLLLDLCGVLK